MSTTIHYSVGDTAALQYQMVYFDGITEKRLLPVDLAGKTVKFNMIHDEFPTVGVFDANCDILEATDGWVMYSFATGETDTAGMYRIIFKLTDSETGEISTYPENNAEAQWLLITDDGVSS